MRESNHINQMNNEPIKDDGGAAFPMHERDDALRGMSLRDWFAGQALTGYLAYSHPDSIMGTFIEESAKVAYEYADAMLKARADSATANHNQTL